jgi:hypothetical protein
VDVVDDHFSKRPEVYRNLLRLQKDFYGPNGPSLSGWLFSAIRTVFPEEWAIQSQVLLKNHVRELGKVRPWLARLRKM